MAYSLARLNAGASICTPLINPAIVPFKHAPIVQNNIFAKTGGRTVFIHDGTKWVPVDEYFIPYIGVVYEESLGDSFSIGVAASSVLGGWSYITDPMFVFDPSLSGLADGASFTSYTCPLSGKTLTNGTLAAPTFVKNSQNGKPSVLMQSSQALYAEGLSPLFPTGEFTIFIVMNIAAMALYQGVLCFSVAGETDYVSANGFSLEKNNTTDALRCTHRAGDMFEHSMSFPYNQFALFTWARSKSLASTVAYKNLGINIGSATGSISSAINATRMALGARVVSGGFDCSTTQTYFSEFAMYDYALPPAEIATVQQNLVTKYAL